jgi:hypothetical protein
MLQIRYKIKAIFMKIIKIMKIHNFLRFQKNHYSTNLHNFHILRTLYKRPIFKLLDYIYFILLPILYRSNVLR